MIERSMKTELEYVLLQEIPIPSKHRQLSAIYLEFGLLGRREEAIG